MSDPVEQVAAHRPYGLDCRCGRPINSDEDWAQHFLNALRFTEERRMDLPGKRGINPQVRLVSPWVQTGTEQ